MTRAFLCTILALGVVACGGANDEVAGTYSMDAAEFEKSMLEFSRSKAPMWDKLPQAAKDQMEKQIKEKVASSSMTLDLDDDGTWKISGQMMGENEINANGTYTLEGDQLTLLTTHENGKKKEKKAKGDEITVTIKDGVIEMKPDPEMPFSVMLRR